MKSLIALCLLALIAAAAAVSIDTEIVGRVWYVAGRFDRLKNTDGTWFAANNLATWDGTKWSTVGEKGTNGAVYTIKIDGKFNIMIGGNFTTVNGVATGPVARYNAVDKKWEAINGGGSFSPGSKVHALATNCFSLTLQGLKSTTNSRCDVYFGGHFNLTGTGFSASNIARWHQKTSDSGEIQSLGDHGIKGTVYALYKKSYPTLTEDSSKYLWVGGDLKGTAKYFGRIEDVESSPKMVALDDNMNGAVRAFRYVIKFIAGQTDRLFLAGDFKFTSSNSVRCYQACEYNHKEKKFVAFAGTESPNFDDGVAWDIALNGEDVFVGGSFTKPFKYVAQIPNGKTSWDAVHGAQSTHIDFPVRTLDVCSIYSKSCKAGSVAAGSAKGEIKFYDHEKGEWRNFGGAKNPLNTTMPMDQPSLSAIYSYAAAGNVKLTFAVLAIVAAVAMIVV